MWLPDDLMASIQTIQTSWETVDSGRQDLQWYLYWRDLNALFSSYEVERGQPMSLSLKIMAKNLWFNTKFNTRAGKIKWTEKYIFLTVLFRMGEKTFFYQCVCVKCRNYKNIEKVAKMRGMEKIIMSNFPARSTQIQHKSDFVQFAIYKKKPRNHYGFKVFLGGE